MGQLSFSFLTVTIWHFRLHLVYTLWTRLATMFCFEYLLLPYFISRTKFAHWGIITWHLKRLYKWFGYWATCFVILFYLGWECCMASGFKFSVFMVSWVNLLGAILSPILLFILTRLEGLQVIRKAMNRVHAEWVKSLFPLLLLSFDISVSI